MPGGRSYDQTPGAVALTLERPCVALYSSLKYSTPGSMNSLFSDFFREFWRGILGGVRDYLGEVLGGF